MADKNSEINENLLNEKNIEDNEDNEQEDEDLISLFSTNEAIDSIQVFDSTV